IGQRFVPRLHNRAAVLLPFHFHRSLQTFEDDHRHAMRTAVGKFRSSERRILSRNALAVCLMAGLTIRSENFFAAIKRSLRRFWSSARSATRPCLLRWDVSDVQTVSGKISRKAAEIRATSK